MKLFLILLYMVAMIAAGYFLAKAKQRADGPIGFELEGHDYTSTIVDGRNMFTHNSNCSTCQH